MENNRDLSLFNFICLWFGAAISISEIITGGLIAPLGFKNGLTVILLGHAAGTLILILGGIIGTDKRIPSIMSTRISFGLYGSYLFSILNVLQLIGWTAVMIISGGRSINIISKALWGFDNLTLWSVFIGLLICIWIVLGNSGFKKLNTAAVMLLFLLTITLSLVVFRNGDLITKQGTGEMTFGTAFELNVIMPLSWLPLIADYTRLAKDKTSGAFGSYIGYFIGSSWMYIIGLASVIVFKESDIGAVMLAANLGFTALGIIILSTVTTTFMDVYSAGVTFLNIKPGLNEKTVSVLIGIIGTILAIVIPIEQYENFLYAIGSVFAPMFAILFADYFIIRKYRELDESLLLNWGTVILWIIGIILYYQLIKFDFIIGTTIPVMMLTSILYCITWRGIEKCKLLRK